MSVLRRGEGEGLFGGSVIVKASPRTGTQGGEMLWNAMAPGQSTGIHLHSQADEFFYVIGGTGLALIGEQESPIATGDVIFIPKGQDHRVRSSKVDPLELIFFVDRPGLASGFRELYAHLESGRWPPTLEEINEIAKKYGDLYKSLE
jgi:quercetin dioxygenase-like cupin family protein